MQGAPIKEHRLSWLVFMAAILCCHGDKMSLLWGTLDRNLDLGSPRSNGRYEWLWDGVRHIARRH